MSSFSGEVHPLRIQLQQPKFPASPMSAEDFVVWRNLAIIPFIVLALHLLFVAQCREWVKTDLRQRSCKPVSVRYRPFAWWVIWRRRFGDDGDWHIRRLGRRQRELKSRGKREATNGGKFASLTALLANAARKQNSSRPKAQSPKELQQ